MQGVKHKNIDPTYWKTALFFLSSSNPKKVNGAMNTNINNKKFKLVSLRNQPMQAFSCKRECDKEASGDGERRRKEEHREIWTVGGGEGVTEGELEEGLRGNIETGRKKKL